MDINTIDELIKDLETSDTSLSNIRNLSALYNVRTHLLDIDTADTTKELSDVLPSYLHYINVKRRYQLQLTTDQALYMAMQDLCKEIREFIQTLYSDTDTPAEREILMQMIKEMQ